MGLGKDTIQRVCSLPPASGVGDRTISACGHPSLKFRLPSEHCVGCIISSHDGGHAVDLPATRNSLPVASK
jgi:hypothetical protein